MVWSKVPVSDRVVMMIVVGHDVDVFVREDGTDSEPWRECQRERRPPEPVHSRGDYIRYAQDGWLDVFIL